MSQACNLLFQDGNLCSRISRSPQWWRQWHRLLPGIVKFNAARDVPELKVPYVAIVGSDDWVCPTSLTKAYVALLRAPSKRFIELRDAGHYAYLDRPTAVQEAIVDVRVDE